MAVGPEQALPVSFWRRHQIAETMAAYALAVRDLHMIVLAAFGCFPSMKRKMFQDC